MSPENESAGREHNGSEPPEASSEAAPKREPPRKRPATPFPKSERAVSQADGDA
jgi:hypothetical protein